MIFSKFRRPLFIVSGFVLGAWLLCMKTNSIGSIEHLYSQQEYCQDLSKIYYDLGALAHKRNDHTKAIDGYTKALATKSDYLEAYDALGQIYEQTGDHTKALQTYLQAMNEDPNFIECRVCHGNLDAVKTAPNPDYEKLSKKISTQSEWAGESLNNKSIYLYAEKGLGDSFQFVRFLPMLAAQGATVYFKPQKPLTVFFKQSFNNPHIIILDAATNPDELTFDYYASLLGVGRYLDLSRENIPGKNAYLNVSHNKITEFKNKLFNNPVFKIGIVWQGDPGHINDKNRSIPLHTFSPLFDIPNVKIYSLQKGFGKEQIAQLTHPEKVCDLDQSIKDFIDTAAVIKNLDLVITADTAVAHLSGALGTPTWILLPHVTDWRWFMHAEDSSSCWYASLTKFRQDTPGDWNTVLDRVSKNVTTLASSK